MKTCEKILIVDDNKWLTYFVKGMLERDGATRKVVVVNDSRKAMEAVAAHNPDLIILDIEMPYVDGGMIADQLRHSPQFSKIPILFLTCFLHKEEARYAVGRTGDVMLAKPARRSELKAAIAACLM